MSRVVTGLSGIFIALITSGCAHAVHQQNVEAQMILPPFATTQEVEADRSYLMAAAINAPMPTYPEGGAPHEDEKITICAELIVNAEGAVSKITSLGFADCSELDSELKRSMFNSVTTAVSQWSYFAAGICTPAGSPPSCDDPDATIEAIPSKLAYAFTFEQTNGKSKVTGAARQADSATRAMAPDERS